MKGEKANTRGGIVVESGKKEKKGEFLRDLLKFTFERSFPQALSSYSTYKKPQPFYACIH